jgi:hypothetical protein
MLRPVKHPRAGNVGDLGEWAWLRKRKRKRGGPMRGIDFDEKLIFIDQAVIPFPFLFYFVLISFFFEFS